MNIQELTKQENELLFQIRNISGSMSERAQQLLDAGIFVSYKKLHQEYANLAAIGDTEALKRATFIQWYAVSEPSCFSGIPGPNPWSADLRLDEEIEKDVLELVQQSILSEQIDAEFNTMLTCYFQISEYYFKYFWENTSLMKKLYQNTQEINFLNALKQLSKRDFRNRGQMGEYWLSRQIK